MERDALNRRRVPPFEMDGRRTRSNADRIVGGGVQVVDLCGGKILLDSVAAVGGKLSAKTREMEEAGWDWLARRWLARCESGGAPIVVGEESFVVGRR